MECRYSDHCPPVSQSRPLGSLVCRSVAAYTPLNSSSDMYLQQKRHDEIDGEVKSEVRRSTVAGQQ